MIRFHQRTPGWPEQYEAFLDGKQVAYLRLSDGRFTVEYPDYGGEVIYSAVAKGHGEFDNKEEQDYYLRFAADAILRHLRGEKRASPPDVSYELAPHDADGTVERLIDIIRSNTDKAAP